MSNDLQIGGPQGQDQGGQLPGKEQKYGVLAGFFTATWLKFEAWLNSWSGGDDYDKILAHLISEKIGKQQPWYKPSVTEKTLRWFDERIIAKIATPKNQNTQKAQLVVTKTLQQPLPSARMDLSFDEKTTLKAPQPPSPSKPPIETSMAQARADWKKAQFTVDDISNNVHNRPFGTQQQIMQEYFENKIEGAVEWLHSSGPLVNQAIIALYFAAPADHSKFQEFAKLVVEKVIQANNGNYTQIDSAINNIVQGSLHLGDEVAEHRKILLDVTRELRERDERASKETLD